MLRQDAYISEPKRGDRLRVRRYCAPYMTAARKRGLITWNTADLPLYGGRSAVQGQSQPSSC